MDDRFHDMIVFQKFLFHPSTQLPVTHGFTNFRPDSVLSHRSVDGEPIFADALNKMRIRVVVGVLLTVLKGTQKSILSSPFQWQRELQTRFFYCGL